MRLEVEPVPGVITSTDAHDLDQGVVSPDFQMLLNNGIASAQKGEREQARSLLSQAADIDPQSEDAWMWLASISDYPEELMAFLNNVLSINPSNERAVEWHTATRSLLARTFVQRGIDAHSQGSDDLAMQCLEQAIDYDDGIHAKHRLMLGRRCPAD